METGKQIFILNGAPRSGKDTFANLMNEFIATKHISSITPIKNAAMALGWNGDKTNKARDFLCEMKKFVNSQGDYIWQFLDKEVREFRQDTETMVLLIDIREPEEIAKAVARYNAKTIKISRPEECAFTEMTNTSDRNVDNYVYDYTVGNFSNMEKFKEIVKIFVDSYIIPNALPLYGKVIAVDFDGTIARTEYPKIIKPIESTINFLKTAKELGAKIILWTCREGKVLDDAVEWCKLHSVPIDYVNENVPERTKYFNNDSRKVGADLYIDDKSVNYIHNNENLFIWLKSQETFVTT